MSFGQIVVIDTHGSKCLRGWRLNTDLGRRLLRQRNVGQRIFLVNLNVGLLGDHRDPLILLLRKLIVHLSNLLLQLMVLLHQVLEILVQQIQIGSSRLTCLRAHDRRIARITPHIPIAPKRFVKYLCVLFLFQCCLWIAIAARTTAPGLRPRQVVMAGATRH